MKLTLLQICQLIASSMDSDEFNSIFDTVESRQIAEVVRSVYYDIAARGNLPEHHDLFELEASGDSSKPTLMTIPDDVRRVDWIKYNKIEEDEEDATFQLVTFLPVERFLDMIHSFSESEDTVGTFDHTIDTSSITFFYRNDRHPDHYTIYDDHTIIFDSYQSAVDSTLQKTKTLAYGTKAPTFTLDDSFIPDLDEQHFALLVNEAKVMSFTELKQVAHQVAAGNARRQWINLQKTKSAAPNPYYDLLPNYGRR